MAADRSTFIKSAYAKTPVSRTRLDIMEVLERYGATGFGYDVVGDDVVVRFTVAGAHGGPLRIAYPVNIARVQQRLASFLKDRGRSEKADRDQAERVAWRNIYEFVDAAFAAAAIGASTVEESFHAHVVVRTSDGSEGRMYDYVETLRNVAGGALPGYTELQKLLPGAKR